MSLFVEGQRRVLPYIQRALRPEAGKQQGALTLIPIANRNLEIGTLAMKSDLGLATYCKAIFLHAYATARSGNNYVTDMRLLGEISGWIDEQIWDAFTTTGRLKHARVYDDYHRAMMLTIHDGARYIRRYTNSFSGSFTDISEVKVAADFLRAILIVRTPY
jgi:hypothetical protein